MLGHSRPAVRYVEKNARISLLHFRRFCLRRAIMRHESRPHERLESGINWKWRGAGNRLSTSSVKAGRPLLESAACRVRRYRRRSRISDGLKPRTSASLGGRPRQTRPLPSGSSSSAARPAFGRRRAFRPPEHRPSSARGRQVSSHKGSTTARRRKRADSAGPSSVANRPPSQMACPHGFRMNGGCTNTAIDRNVPRCARHRASRTRELAAARLCYRPPAGLSS
jgi:hypothetical protein